MQLLLKPTMTTGGVIKLTSNGPSAKTAKITVVANSGKPIQYRDTGLLVWDMAGMKAKAKIPLDWHHGDSSVIGYLNQFDTSTGQLICSGAITPTSRQDDVGTMVVELLQGGAPFEASVESWTDEIELIDEGEFAMVNGNVCAGPLTILRKWELKAVAVCKFGADAETSTVLAASAAKAKNNLTSEKVIFTRLSKRISMDDVNNTPEAVTATEEVAPEVTPVVEVVEAETVEADQEIVQANVEAAPAAVEAVAPVEIEEAPVAIAASVEPVVEAVDARSEFKRFVATFGNDAAAYFAEGLSFADAQTKHVAAVQKENDELRKRLAAIDRGAPKPIAFSANDEPAKPKSFISLKAKK